MTRQQTIPRQRLPEAIIDGHCSGYAWDGFSLEGHSHASTIRARTFARAYAVSLRFLFARHDSRFGKIHRGVSPSVARIRGEPIDLDGKRSQFADVILPACTSLERWTFRSGPTAPDFSTMGRIKSITVR